MKKHLFYLWVILIHVSTVAYPQPSSRLINAVTVDSIGMVIDSTSYLYSNNRTYGVYDSNIIFKIDNLHINSIISSIAFPLGRITSIDEELFCNNSNNSSNFRFLKSFDSTGKCLEIITQKAPHNTINWESIYKENFSYTNNNLTQYDRYEVDVITNQWKASHKYQFLYNPQNKIQECYASLVHNGTEDTFRYYKYHYANNRLDSLITHNLYGDTTKHSIIYNNNIISKVYFFVNNKSNLYTEYTFLYDANNNNIETTAIHTTPNPANNEVAYYQYTSSNSLDSIAYFVNYPNHTDFYSTKLWHNPFNQITELDFGDGYKKLFRYENLTTQIDKLSSIDNKVAIYPSPTYDFINIDISFLKEQNFTATIVDVQGKVWMKWNHPKTKNYQKKIAINDWIDGNYFLILQTKKGKISKPFTVLH